MWKDSFDAGGDRMSNYLEFNPSEHVRYTKHSPDEEIHIEIKIIDGLTLRLSLSTIKAIYERMVRLN